MEQIDFLQFCFLTPPLLSVNNNNRTIFVLFNSKIGSAKLPEQGQEYESGDPAVVSGWGTLSSGGDVSDVLMKVEVPIVSDLGMY
jgi:hypothetical protein